MSDNELSELEQAQPDEATLKRQENIDKFIEWVRVSGMHPLDYELVEDRSDINLTVWYLRKRTKSEEIQPPCSTKIN